MAYFIGYTMAGFMLTAQMTKEVQPADPTAPIEVETFWQPWRISLISQSCALAFSTLIVMLIPAKYLQVEVAQEARFLRMLTENAGKKMVDGQPGEVEWNLYSKFGPPSVVMGFGFNNKVI